MNFFTDILIILLEKQKHCSDIASWLNQHILHKNRSIKDIFNQSLNIAVPFRFGELLAISIDITYEWHETIIIAFRSLWQKKTSMVLS